MSKALHAQVVQTCVSFTCATPSHLWPPRGFCDQLRRGRSSVVVQGWSAQRVGPGGQWQWWGVALSGCRALGSGPSWRARGVGGGKWPFQGQGVQGEAYRGPWGGHRGGRFKPHMDTHHATGRQKHSAAWQRPAGHGPGVAQCADRTARTAEMKAACSSVPWVSPDSPAPGSDSHRGLGSRRLQPTGRRPGPEVSLPPPRGQGQGRSPWGRPGRWGVRAAPGVPPPSCDKCPGPHVPTRQAERPAVPQSGARWP